MNGLHIAAELIDKKTLMFRVLKSYQDSNDTTALKEQLNADFPEDGRMIAVFRYCDITNDAYGVEVLGRAKSCGCFTCKNHRKYP